MYAHQRRGQVVMYEWLDRVSVCVMLCSYVLGGDTGCGVASDVWCSGDGEHWELVWAEKHCCARIGHSVVTFKYSVAQH
jgi:hypothetical protein